MLLNPEIGDIVYLCPEADASRFTYYQEDNSYMAEQYEEGLSALRKGGSGVIKNITDLSPYTGNYGDDIRRMFKSGCSLYVMVCVDKRRKRYRSLNFPDWMLYIKSCPGRMLRATTPDITRRM